MPTGQAPEETSRLAARSGGASLEKIFQVLTDGLLVIDESERVVLINPAAERLLGVKQPGLFALSTLDECIADRKLLRRFRAAAKGGERRLEYELAGELPAVVAVQATAVPPGEGSPGGTAFVLHDITRERTLDRLKSEFISTAAHELRTPLTSIMGFSELLLLDDGIAPPQRRDYLGFIHQKAQNLGRIISDLLDISRIEAGRGLELSREKCDLNSLVKETVEPYQRRCDRHRLTLTLPPKAVELPVDPGKFVQVLENLISNARKYSPRGGEIEVAASEEPGAYQVTVRDQGIGMTREEAARAFDKFYRVDSSNTAVSGTGLGLSIAKYIVEAHGGRIWLESRKGKGTVVSFVLPLLPRAPEPELFEEETATPSAAVTREEPIGQQYAAAPPKP